MTEEEARTKWCPMYRVATSGGDHHTFEMDNRPVEHDMNKKPPEPTGRVWEGARCIGSACMAWRWKFTHSQMGGHPGDYSDTDGHCGLAGTP